MAKAVKSVSGAGVREHWLDQKFTTKAVAERKAFMARNPLVPMSRANSMTPRAMIEYEVALDGLAQQDAFYPHGIQHDCVVVPPYVS